MSRYAALITGAGSSARMADGHKKEYRLIGDLPVVAKSIETFQQTGRFSIIIVTVPHDHVEKVGHLISPFLSLDGIELTEGGETRRESVRKGLCALEKHRPDYVLIHDAARPWVPENLVCEVMEKTEQYGACIPVFDSRDALVEVDPEGYVMRHFSKQTVKGVQTPQGFVFTDILQAHRQMDGGHPEFYDDAQIWMQTGKKVFTVPGSPANRKITYPCDLEDQ